MKAAEYARTMNTMATVVGCPVEGVRESMHFAVADWATVEMAADKGEGGEGLRGLECKNAFLRSAQFPRQDSLIIHFPASACEGERELIEEQFLLLTHVDRARSRRDCRQQVGEVQQTTIIARPELRRLQNNQDYLRQY